jgi:hypothetical protein
MKRHNLIFLSIFLLLAAGGNFNRADGSPTTQKADTNGGTGIAATQRADSAHRPPTTASDDAAARKFGKFTDLAKRLLAVAYTGWDGLDAKLAAMEEEYATLKSETEPAKLCALAKDVMETARGLQASQRNFEKLKKLYLLGQIQTQMYLASRDDVSKHVDGCGDALTAYVAEAKKCGL